jgi:hypothetical protein
MRLLQIDYSLREIPLHEFMYRKIQVIIYLANTLNNKWILLFTLHYHYYCNWIRQQKPRRGLTMHNRWWSNAEPADEEQGKGPRRGPIASINYFRNSFLIVCLYKY